MRCSFSLLYTHFPYDEVTFILDILTKVLFNTAEQLHLLDRSLIENLMNLSLKSFLTSDVTSKQNIPHIYFKPAFHYTVGLVC